MHLQGGERNVFNLFFHINESIYVFSNFSDLFKQFKLWHYTSADYNAMIE